MGRVVGIDFGTKKIGVSATDPLMISVHGQGTFHINDIRGYISDYLKNETVDKIVIGMPPRPSQSFDQALEKFVKWLKEETDAPEIVFHDEDFTSIEAKRAILISGATKKQRRDKSLIDEISAIILLQDYLGHREDF